jgi:hypothetical protein
MANGAPSPQNTPSPFEDINRKLDSLAARIGALETTVGEVKRTAGEVEIGTGELKTRAGDLRHLMELAIGEAKIAIGDVKTTVRDLKAAVDSLRTSVDNAKGAADKAKDSADNAKTAADAAKKGSIWPAFWTGVTGAIIAAGASIWVGQRNFDAALAVTKAEIDNAAKKAFETARGASSLQDYETGRGLIGKIETEFRESAVQGSVKKELGGDLHGFKLLADRLKVPALTELSGYAGQLLYAYSKGDKHWVDYEKQERQNLEQRGDKALQALEDWAKSQ